MSDQAPLPPAEPRAVRISKFLSFVLRHNPHSIGLTLDSEGWASVELLIEKAAASGTSLTRDELVHVVETNDKRRFTLSPDSTRIRAAQGHSVDVGLGVAEAIPPDALYHGTATRFLVSILAEGLQRGSRRQVHLTAERDTALAVGQRHGQPVVLVVDTIAMRASGHAFYQADNGVWLTDSVPPAFLAVT
ncbi:MAG: RNA 2'-phosphotransferase [Hyphomicrobiaceae bacterium]